MRRIHQVDVADVASATGHGRVALGYLNDAIIEIYNKNNGRWYSLLATNQFDTQFEVIVTVEDNDGLDLLVRLRIVYQGVTRDYISADSWPIGATAAESASNLATVINNDNVLTTLVATVVDNVITVRPPLGLLGGITSTLTTVNFDGDIPLTSALAGRGDYILPSNFGSAFVIKDLSNNRIIPSEWDKIIDFDDPDEDSIGTILIYSIRTDHYRFYPKPSAIVTIKEAYWKLVSRLDSNSDLYDLPEFCETAILKVAEAETWYYLDKNSKGDRARGRAKILIEDAVETNDSILDRIITLDSDFSSARISLPLIPPFLGSNFARPHGF